MKTLEKVTSAVMTRERDIMLGADRTQQSADPRAIARAAVGALRDPPDAILLAVGEPYGGKIDRYAGLQARRHAWNKMLDAILSEVA